MLELLCHEQEYSWASHASLPTPPSKTLVDIEDKGCRYQVYPARKRRRKKKEKRKKQAEGGCLAEGQNQDLSRWRGTRLVIGNAMEIEIH